jgi:hypothetical protein
MAGPVIIGGMLLALLVLQVPNILLWSLPWRPGTAFAAQRPDWGWLPWGYTLFLILWTPSSIIATAVAVEQTTPAVFLAALILIPYGGAVFILGLFEAATGISLRVGQRPAKVGDWRLLVRTSASFLTRYTVCVAGPAERVRAVGGLRAALAALTLLVMAVVVYEGV